MEDCGDIVSAFCRGERSLGDLEVCTVVLVCVLGNSENVCLGDERPGELASMRGGSKKGWQETGVGDLRV